jgi:hypothetical protein
LLPGKRRPASVGLLISGSVPGPTALVQAAIAQFRFCNVRELL